MRRGGEVTLHLDPAEIATLAPGLTQPAAIVRELRRLGIRAELRRDGSVLVLRAWLTQDCRRAQHAGEQEPALHLD